MRLHPRTIPVKVAGNDIGRIVLERVNEFNPSFDDLMHEFGNLLASDKLLRGSLAEEIQNAARKSGLTRAELWGIVGREIQDWAKSALRTERHPDKPDQPADEA